jgi:hypothetical protein
VVLLKERAVLLATLPVPTTKAKETSQPALRNALTILHPNLLPNKTIRAETAKKANNAALDS